MYKYMKNLLEKYLNEISDQGQIERYEGYYINLAWCKWNINSRSYRCKIYNDNNDEFEFSFIDFEDFKDIINNSNI